MDSQLVSKKLIASLSTSAHVDSWWNAMKIWHDKPQYVNKRVSSAFTLYVGKVLYPDDSQQLLARIMSSKAMESTELPDILNEIKKCKVILEKQETFSVEDKSIFITIKKLLPKNEKLFKSIFELSILDTSKNEAVFLNTGLRYSVLAPAFPYSIEFQDEDICLSVYTADAEDRSALWLQNHLLPRLQRWAENEVKKSPAVESLSLISVEKYVNLYQMLKEKYGQELVKVWPEKTDPLKFVYEDIAIATYLLLLWEDQRNLEGRPEWRQSFVDVGCGNGLLVYILSSEGHPGLGIDVRKRNIWNLYPNTTKLKVQTFVPSDCSLFPEADWIIGNHSDELTPWVPVIAARSSYKCNFFLLPCCAYYFTGAKYQRVDSSKSQYSEYLDFVKNICCECGFDVKIDRLRIPSTKRTCLLGMKRYYCVEDFETKCKEVIEYVRRQSEEIKPGKGGCEDCENFENFEAAHTSEEWISNFKPREGKERVRNCTQLNKELVQTIMKQVTDILLKKSSFITVSDADGQEKLWNAGGSITLGELASQLSKEHLKQLKKECGGLQTLLKNNYKVFSVCGGRVQLIIPSGREKRLKTEKNFQDRKVTNYKYKQMPCWFFYNHPDGCPLKDEDCTFQHESDVT